MVRKRTGGDVQGFGGGNVQTPTQGCTPGRLTQRTCLSISLHLQTALGDDLPASHVFQSNLFLLKIIISKDYRGPTVDQPWDVLTSFHLPLTNQSKKIRKIAYRHTIKCFCFADVILAHTIPQFP